MLWHASCVTTRCCVDGAGVGGAGLAQTFPSRGGACMAHELRETTAHAADDGLFRQPPGLPDPVMTVNGRIVLEKRYLRREGGKVLETPGGGFWRVAADISRGTEKFDGPEVGERVR